MAERSKKATIEYRNDGGGTSKRVDAAFPIVVFKFDGAGEVKLDTREVTQELAVVASIRGLTEKIRDTFAGSESAADAAEEAASMIEVLLAGDWYTERASAGPRPTVVAEAVIRALREAGKAIDEATEATVRSMFTGKGTEQARKDAMADPAIYKHVVAIRAEREAERLAEMQKAGKPSILAGLVA
jgi:hypothetical protein